MYTLSNRGSILSVLKLSLVALAVTGLSACFDGDSKTNKVNNRPSAMSINVITQTETAISDNLTASDLDNDILTFTISDEPSSGMVTINGNGSFTYLPALEFTGSDSFTFSATDPQGLSANGTVDITVEALQVQFTQFARGVFAADASSVPVSVNGREFIQDGIDTTDYQDLIDNQ